MISDQALKAAKEYSSSLYGFDEYCKQIEIQASDVINEYALAFHALFELDLCSSCLYSEDECFDDETLLSMDGDTMPHGFKATSEIVSEYGSPFPCYDLTALKLMYRILAQ